MTIPNTYSFVLPDPFLGSIGISGKKQKQNY
jgi:hypothetical protein